VPDFDEVPFDELDDPDEVFESDFPLSLDDLVAFESEPEPESLPAFDPLSEDELLALLRDRAESELSVL
jgi:hypothetical protein